MELSFFDVLVEYKEMTGCDSCIYCTTKFIDDKYYTCCIKDNSINFIVASNNARLIACDNWSVDLGYVYHTEDEVKEYFKDHKIIFVKHE